MSKKTNSKCNQNNIDVVRKMMHAASEAFRAAVVQRAFDREIYPEGYCPGQISCDHELFPTWEAQS